MENFNKFDNEIDVIALAFATRQILYDLNRDLIIERALENLTDFGRSERIGIWLLDDQENAMTLEGGLVSGKPVKESVKKTILQTPLEGIIANGAPSLFPLTYEQGIPWPTDKNGSPGRQCLCIPLVVADNRVTGVVTLDQPEDFTLDTSKMLPLIVLLTVVAVGLEMVRLFRLAVIDGLTGLYVRRYMELRLAEEVNRIKRYGGQMAVMITDIDHFKKFNDTYGHQQGDTVLRETAELMQKTVRTDIDVVCRFGGEEFVVIMPNTDKAGAMIVAERIRQRCEECKFSGQEKPLHVTLSGGLALMTKDLQITDQELLRRADEALYRAKEGGRNRIELWSD